MTDCIFCKIAKGEIPAEKVYEDEETIAFLDIEPVAKGHTLVIPKKHFETMDEMDEETMLTTQKTVQKIAKALLKFNQGYNVNQNNKPEAGQIVPHVHYHIIPRNKNKELLFTWPKIKISKEEMEEEKSKIKSFLK